MAKIRVLPDALANQTDDDGLATSSAASSARCEAASASLIRKPSLSFYA